MLDYLRVTNIDAELICFVLALLCLLKGKSSVWKIIIPYLFVVCATEISGKYLKLHHQANQWPYNVLLIGEIFYMNVMFAALFNKYIKSKPLIISGFALLIMLYIYDLFDHGFLIYNNTTYTVLSILLVLYSLYYYYLLLNDDNYVELKFLPEFWWVAGILFFYFGSTTVNLFHGKLSAIKITAQHYLPYYIGMVLDLILYGCWSYSFICKKWISNK